MVKNNSGDYLIGDTDLCLVKFAGLALITGLNHRQSGASVAFTTGWSTSISVRKIGIKEYTEQAFMHGFQCYRPLNVGFRFSLKASTPSLRSRVGTVR